MRGLRLLLAGAISAAGLTAVVSPPAAAATATVQGFSQCANGTGTAVTCAGGWINGAIQGSNSHYTEDQVVPQRAVLRLPADDLEHSLTFTYQDRKGSTHAYDSLATWNKTVTGADPCQGLAASLCAGAPSTLAMSDDPAPNIPPVGPGISPAVVDHQLPAADRQWTLYGGVLTSDAVIGHSSPAAGDDLVTVTVRFRNPTPTQARDVVLLFGGHLAVGGPNTLPRAWGQNLGASSVSGGPYSFKLVAVDDGSTGATTNSIQASAAEPVAPAAFTIAKTATPATASPGQVVTYTVTVTNTGGQPGTTTFRDDHADTVTPSAVTSAPSGGSCTPAVLTGGNQVLDCATSSLAAGASQVFTYTATMPGAFTSGAGSGGCAAGHYPVANTATLTGGNAATGAGPASATVCVDAAAQFTITKTADTLTPAAGDPVTYTVTVTNTGSASGSTTFGDDFDDRLSPSTATSVPAGNNCSPTNVSGNKVFSCTTATLAPGASQVFTYTAQMPGTFDGGAGTDGCGPNRYPVANTATIGSTGSSAVTVCVLAALDFTVTKTADDLSADPGQPITYTITVRNNGTASGSTTFRDDFDDRLSPGSATSTPAGNDCAPSIDAGNELFDCTTGTIPAGGSQTFTYTAAMPPTFSGPSGTGSCATGSYPVANTVTLANDRTDSVTVCVGAGPNFELTKTVDDDSPAPGGTVTYTVEVTNTGAAAGETSFTDVFDPRMQVTLPTGDCAFATLSGSFTCATGTVAAGETVTFTYTATVPASFGPTSGGGDCTTGTYPLENTASLADGPGASVTLCVAAAPDFAVTKTVDDASGVPGQVVTYTITVENTGTAAGTTSFVDDFDDRLEPTAISSSPDTGSCSVVGTNEKTLSCATGVIPAGEEQVFTYAVTLPATYDGDSGAGSCDPGTFRIANTVELNGGADAAGVDVCVAAAPSFVVSKTVDKAAPVPGDTVTYTITVTNNGTAAGSTTFADDPDSRLTPSDAVSDPGGDDCSPVDGAFSCTTGVIDALGQQTFTYTATLPSTFSGDGGGGPCAPGTFLIVNRVELAGGAEDEVSLCVTAAPEFEVTKTVDQDEVGPGDTVEYTLRVDNVGDSSGSTTIVDDYDALLDPTVPAGCTKAGGELTCTTDTIEAGESESFTYTAQVPDTFTGESGLGDCGPGEFRIANSVTVVDSSSADSADVCVAAAPAFTVTKDADDTTVGTGDLVTYTVTVRNVGTAPGSTEFTDDFDDSLAPSSASSSPSGHDCVPTEDEGDEQFVCATAALDPGASQTFTYTALMPDSFDAEAATGGCAAGRYAVVNTVSVQDSSDVVTICVAAAPAFTIAKSAGQVNGLPGGSVTYTVTVTNTGDAEGSTTFTDVADATITSTPAGCELVDAHELACTTVSLEAGESAEFQYGADLPTTYTGAPDADACQPPAYPVLNVATLANGEQAEAVVCVGATPEFTVEKSVLDATPDPTDTAVYLVVVENVGSAPGSVTVTDTPDGLFDLSGVIVPEDCTLASGTFSCDTGPLAVGETRSFTFNLGTPATYDGTPGAGSCADDRYLLTNTAGLPGGAGDAADVCVAAAPSFTVTKEAEDTSVSAGEDAVYTITVRNDGTAAGAVSFEDLYDDRIEPGVVTISGTGGSCSDDGTSLSCTTGTIAAGASQTFRYTAAMPASFTGAPGNGCGDGSYPVINTVEAADASDTVTVCVSAAPDIAVNKTASTLLAAPGQVVTYTVKVSNTGTAPAPGSFTDTFANDLDPEVVSTDGATCEVTAGATQSTLDCSYDIAAGGQASVVYSLTMPATFDGPSGLGGCEEGEYPVLNEVTASTSGDAADDAVTVCVDAEALFAIEKTVDEDEVAEPGQTLTYSIVVSNNGTASGSTTFVDAFDGRLDPTVPDGCTEVGDTLECETGVIAAGASRTFTYEATLPDAFGTNDGTNGCAAGTFAVRNAVALEDGPGDSVTVCVEAAPDFTITKVVDDDLGVPGQQVTYTVTVVNGGDAAGVAVFTDDYADGLTGVTVPDGCTAGAGSLTCTTGVLAAGEEQAFTYSATLPEAFTGASGSDACASGTFEIANTADLEDGPAVTETVCVEAAPEFAIAKSVDDDTVLPGATVTYTIEIRNVGTASGSTTFSDSFDSRLEPTVPDDCTVDEDVLSCDTGDLAAGETATFTYSAELPATYTGTPGGGTCADDRYRVSNTATLEDGPSASEDVCVLAAPDFTVTKDVDDATALPGQSVRYTVTVTNEGDAAGRITFVDDYDSRLTPTEPAGCVRAAGTLTCTTDVLAAGDVQVFEYDAAMPLTYAGASGIVPCAEGEYGVANLVRIGDDEVASQTVCVAAAPEFTVAKSADDLTAEPGQQVGYAVTVANTGSVAGSTTFVDTYDERLDPTVPDGCTATDGTLRCTTTDIEPGEEQVFSYTATMPASFTGPAGLGGCATDTFPIANGVLLANGDNAAVTVCVEARTDVVLKKESSVDHQSNGDQVLTYELTWINSGAAEANQVVLTDVIPAGTSFVSCTAGCSVGGSPLTATWNVGTIAPLGGTDSVTLVVKLVSNQICSVPNAAQIKVGADPAISSNTVSDNVSPQPDPTTAKANGSAIGLQVKSSGIVTLITGLLSAVLTNNSTATFGNASSSQTGLGGPSTGSDSVLSVKLPTNGSLLSAGVISTTSASSVTAAPAEARQTTTSEVAGVCLIPVAGVCTVETGTIRAVASTMANGSYASASSTGSTIQSLKIVGLATPVDLNQTTTIPLNPLVFGKNSYVAINERTSKAGLSGGKYVADQSVAMIHVKITGLLLGVQAAEIYVAQATAHSEFPKTFVCGDAKTRSVSGHAYTARLHTGPILADLLQGYAQISPLGGSETEQVAAVALPAGGGVLGARVADSSTSGSFNSSSSTARSWAQVLGDGDQPVCVLRAGTCVVSATTVRSEARSDGTASGSTSTDAGTALVDLRVLGLPVSGTPPPNTVRALPGIGFIVLNEQFCDNGGAANGSCTGPGHSGITVRALRVVVTVANNLLGLTPGIELIVAEAHADTTFQ